MQMTSTAFAPVGFVHVPDDVKVWISAPPEESAALIHVVPLLVKTFPFVPGATNCTALVPLPRMTLLAVSVVAPVPPKLAESVPKDGATPAPAEIRACPDVPLATAPRTLSLLT
jgi:hypothetical protein